ncbi:unnamed protein product [Heligmosomoides polygyrus]|uniref:MOSC domain-containing protein n=1 Tax=Heligmosomoides polygyrus TaxID=6339 RepID=A0A183F7U8_HELPZ|nr:unnamed protein product [Heligmosomoides polygyrus]
MMTLKTRFDAKNALRCSPVDDVASDVGVADVGDVSPKYNTGLRPGTYFHRGDADDAQLMTLSPRGRIVKGIFAAATATVAVGMRDGIPRSSRAWGVLR